ncbi:MAG TPA: S8 family serine peptidase [Aggregatilineales bacterium]|nr:S8 family serine peptidase [Aggregatilineales bacterium]
MSTPPLFTPNYPSADGSPLLSTPDRLGASPHYSGQGVVIAFIDSGFYPHPDLDDRILCHADATSSRVEEHFSPPGDYSWHGQMCSVIAAGDGCLSSGMYRGIASGAELVLIKVSDARERIKEADILRGLRWLIQNHRRFKVRLLNMAVGGDRPSRDPGNPMLAAIRQLVDEGVMVFAAAGNSGSDRLVPPASSREVITVGGIDDQNSRDASLWLPYPNNWGTAYDGTAKPDVTAPARWIASPILPGSSVDREARWLAPLLQVPSYATVDAMLYEAHLDLSLSREAAIHPNAHVYKQLQERIHAHKLIHRHYQHVDGTSVAVSIATSVAAQMLEANPGLTPQNIKAILTATAKRLSGVPAERQGYGVIDAALAVSTAAIAATMLPKGDTQA